MLEEANSWRIYFEYEETFQKWNKTIKGGNKKKRKIKHSPHKKPLTLKDLFRFWLNRQLPYPSFFPFFSCSYSCRSIVAALSVSSSIHRWLPLSSPTIIQPHQLTNNWKTQPPFPCLQRATNRPPFPLATLFLSAVTSDSNPLQLSLLNLTPIQMIGKW